jgi:hypothetical protein
VPPEYHLSDDATGDPSGNKTLSDLGITRDQSSQWQQLADVPDEEFERALAEPEKPSASRIINRTSFTGDNQWFTPDRYLVLARRVLGDFDLDPASHSIAQDRVRAKRFFTEQDDGLTQKWFGRVWTNEC